MTYGLKGTLPLLCLAAALVNLPACPDLPELFLPACPITSPSGAIAAGTYSLATGTVTPIWLAMGHHPDQLEVLRRHADKGLPCGSATFIQELETLTGRALQYRPRGRPKKGEAIKG